MSERKKPILDAYVKSSVDYAGNKHDRNGRYQTLTLRTDTSDYGLAREYRNALYRSAYHLGVTLDCSMEKDAAGKYAITFTAVHPDYKERWSPLETWKRQRRSGH